MFALGGNALIGLISDLESVQQNAAIYLPWLIAMPLVAMWCFLFDGVFIGATKGQEMRNSMFIATCGFFCLFWVFSEYQNHALWLSMLVFMGLRGMTLALVFYSQWKRSAFL
jgi:MATE family multidrug resistance protein